MAGESPNIVERDMTDAELARGQASRAASAAEHRAYQLTSASIGVVALDHGAYVGSASIEVYRHATGNNGWAYLAELFVEKAHRRRGLGAALLARVEARAAEQGISNIWTRTASFEAPAFYRGQGYRACFELERYYPSGHGVVGFRKTLAAPKTACEVAGVSLVDRAMTENELARMNEGFVEHAAVFDTPPEMPERHGFVAYRGGAFVACLSGLATTFGHAYGTWFVLTDLHVDPSRRRRGLGTSLVRQLDHRLATLGVEHVSVRIAGHDELRFFASLGFETVCEFEDWYGRGNGSLLLRRKL